MYSIEDLIYLAAIIDGEGSISIEIQNARKNRKTDYYTTRVVVINTHVGLMNWLHATFGGKIQTRKLIGNHKQCYNWVIHSLNAVKLLEACLPYFKIRKPHAEVIIEFSKSKPKGTWNVSQEVQEHRRILYAKLKEINKTY